MTTTSGRATAGTFSKPHVRLPLEMGLLLLGAELTRRLELPWAAAGVVFAVLALVQGVRALRALRRARLAGDQAATGPFPTALVALGVALAVGLVALQAVMLAFYPVLQEHRDCTARALTNTARVACDERLQDRLQELTVTRLGA